MTVIKEFGSITEIASYVATHPIVTRKMASQKPADEDFDNNLGFGGAIAVAKRGGYWEEGAKMIMETSVEMGNMVSSRSVPSVDLSVTGFLPNVPAYLAGQPENMYIMNDDGATANDKVLRIGVHCGRPGFVDAYQIMNRGAAIVSVIDELEAQGVRCELYSVYANKTEKHDREFAIIVSTLVKAAHEPWSPHSCAFALCHPAFQRRLMWRFAESREELGSYCQEGYGIGREWKGEDYDVAIKWFAGGFETREEALAQITDEFQKQLTGRGDD